MLVVASIVSAPGAGLTAQTQTVTIRGAVMDSSLARPVAGAAIYVDRTTPHQITDSTGLFLLDGIERGSHVLDFLKDGYAPRTFSIVINEREDEEVNVGTVLLSHGPAPSANISGIVLDSLTRSPVISVDVRINGEHAAATRADGEFSIPSVQLHWGTNILEFQHPGYRQQWMELWPTTEWSAVYSEFILTPLSIELDEVVVVGERTAGVVARSAEFERRRLRGYGHYITREDIERRQPRKLSELLGRIPGVIVIPDVKGALLRIQSRGEYSILNKKRGALGDAGLGCIPDYFVDGVRVNILTGRGAENEISIDDVVQARDVDGIEVYKGPATTPPRFRQTDSGCGAIVIWTR
jgi:hypothetical protein